MLHRSQINLKTQLQHPNYRDLPKDCHPLKKIALQIREQRKAKGWTQAQLANFSGTTRKAVGLLERDGGTVKITAFIRICSTLELDPTSFLGLQFDLSSSDSILSQIGQTLTDHRKTYGLSIRQLAQQTGMNYQSIWRYENGLRDVPLNRLIQFML